MPEPTRLTVDRPALTPEQEARADELLADDTPEAARREVRQLQARARRDLFVRSVPERFHGATYADLDPDLQSAATVAGWLDSEKPTLILAGGPGLGKTHAAYAVLADAVSRGLWVYGSYIVDLLDAMKPDAPHSPAPRLAVQADLFLFDDLGAERLTDWSLEQIRQVVDLRTREGKRQIVTTNLGYAELEARFDRPVWSRLTGGATIARFDGTDRRRTEW